MAKRRFEVVKPDQAAKRATEGQHTVHRNAAISSVRESMRHERDPTNQALLRRAHETLKGIRDPEPNDVKARALRRV